MTARDFLEGVILYCAITGGSITSWGRTTRHNREVGGVRYSAHRFWRGADVLYDAPIPPTERRELARRLGLRVVIESDHDHLQPLTWEKS